MKKKTIRKFKLNRNLFATSTLDCVAKPFRLRLMLTKRKKSFLVAVKEMVEIPCVHSSELWTIHKWQRPMIQWFCVTFLGSYSIICLSNIQNSNFPFCNMPKYYGRSVRNGVWFKCFVFNECCKHEQIITACFDVIFSRWFSIVWILFFFCFPYFTFFGNTHFAMLCRWAAQTTWKTHSNNTLKWREKKTREINVSE